MKTKEELRKSKHIYDLLRVLKDSDKPEDIKAMQEIWEDCGFWANSKEEENKFVAPFQEHRRSFVLTAPATWEKGKFPPPGDYSFALVTKQGLGIRESFIETTVFYFYKENYFSLSKRHRGYLFTFLDEKKKLCLYDYSVIKDKESPYYEKSLRMQKREQEVKQECVKFIPELAHYLWPDQLDISGSWKEEELSHPNFFKKTFEMLSSGYYSYVGAWTFPFTPLVWENNEAQITKEITYTAVDYNHQYMYGIIKKREFREDIGIWLKQEENHISFNVKFRDGETSFANFKGKLYPDYIEFSIPFYNKSPKEKAYLIEHFDQYGLLITNL
ncbi:hypothetical protein NMK71_05540 [Weeksellaceae bacterium KMM 9713]|uniref:Uncharacterized protein n=1 Tax=Profundicola chukchiensis TaxID=2961959 RepID=A0A9X4RVK7_9FLAO|nr:hypothetical protein [Profundicola chukchiensis]MDG4945870.1 hypothetical protein [Profundicola chukchiensis]